jgi:hypothetical protein
MLWKVSGLSGGFFVNFSLEADFRPLRIVYFA